MKPTACPPSGVKPRPRPFEPLAVDVSGEEKVLVGGCTGALSLEEERPSGVPRSHSRTILYTLELDDGGEPRVVGAGSAAETTFTLPTGVVLTDDVCGAVEVKSALFEPSPDLDVEAAKELDDLVLPPSSSR